MTFCDAEIEREFYISADTARGQMQPFPSPSDVRWNPKVRPDETLLSASVSIWTLISEKDEIQKGPI
jgi:hypothetical protein